MVDVTDVDEKEDGSAVYSLDMTQDEVDVLFLYGLQTLVKDTHVAVSLRDSELLGIKPTKTIDINDETANAVVSLGVITCLENLIASEKTSGM